MQSGSGSPTSRGHSVLDNADVKPFLDPAFNSTEYAGRVLRDPQQSTAAKSDDLQEVLRKLDDAIHAEVVGKQDELLQHARQLQVSEKSLQRIKTSITALSSSAQRLKKDIKGPFDVLQQQVTQLSNLHAVADTLRVVNHRVKQTSKLRQLPAPGSDMDPMDMAKAAKLVFDIESVGTSEAVAGIEVIDRYDADEG
jgi:DNA repair ATPase RecN